MKVPVLRRTIPRLLFGKRYVRAVMVGMAVLLHTISVVVAQEANPNEECMKAWVKIESAYTNLTALVHVEVQMADGTQVSPLDYEIKLLGGMRYHQVTETLPPPPFTYVLVEREDAYFRLMRDSEIWKPVKLHRKIRAPVDKFFCEELVEGFSHFGIPITRSLEFALINPSRFERVDDDKFEFEFTETANPKMRTIWSLRPSLGWVADEKNTHFETNGKTYTSATKIRYDGVFRGVQKISEVVKSSDSISSHATVFIDDAKPLAVFFSLTHFGLSEGLLGSPISSPSRGYTVAILFLVGLVFVSCGVYFYRKARERE